MIGRVFLEKNKQVRSLKNKIPYTMKGLGYQIPISSALKYRIWMPNLKKLEDLCS
jgi:hypothetical protein